MVSPYWYVLFITIYLQKDGADVIILLFKEMKALLESNVRYSRYNCAVYNRGVITNSNSFKTLSYNDRITKKALLSLIVTAKKSVF